MADSHSAGPGSIPGRRIIFNNLLEAKLFKEKKENTDVFWGDDGSACGYEVLLNDGSQFEKFIGVCLVWFDEV